MKKISAVLLVLVLVGSVAFAGFTGSASVGVGYNLDTGDYGFIEQGTGVTVDVNFLELVGDSEASGKIYADIAATLNFTFNNGVDEEIHDPTATYPETATYPIWASLDFDYAKIVADDWYVGILGAPKAPNFASSAIDTAKVDKDPNPLGYGTGKKVVAADVNTTKVVGNYGHKDDDPATHIIENGTTGIEVGFMDFVVGANFVGNAKSEKYHGFVSLKTPEFEIADGITAQAGAAVALAKEIAASFSAKFDYADDDLAVGVAADAVLEGKDIAADVALAASYTDYSLDVYYATEVNDGTKIGVKNLLSAQVAAVIDPVTITFTGKDLINTQDLGLEVAFQATEELAVSVNGGYNIGTEVWKAGADVEYETDAFVAALGGSYNSKEILAVSASIASETVVPGATLKLAYVGADDLMKKGDAYDATTGDNTQLGKVVASVAIAF